MNQRLVRGVYSLGILGTSPGVLAYLAWRTLVMKKELPWSERFGHVPRRPRAEHGRVWCHAVSAGEAAAAAPVLRRLRALRPNLDLLVSTTTPAGREMAQRACPEGTATVAYPVDWSLCVQASLRRTQPDVIVLVELEIWPNFIRAAAAMGVPILLINGRISDRGIRRALWIRPWLEGPLRTLDLLGMQSALDAERALRLGARPESVQVLGNTKFDEEAGPLDPAEAQELRRSLGLAEDDDLLLAGSTRPGEEQALLQVYRQLRPTHPRLRLALAPRHLSRAAEVQATIEASGLGVVRRSAGPLTGGLSPDRVILLDTMGELARLYAAARLAFVGGTLAPIGGHNLLQPVAQGIPVLFGPHYENNRDIAALLLQQGVGFCARDAADLANQAAGLLRERGRLESLRHRCLATMEENRGASQRYADHVLRLLDSPARAAARYPGRAAPAESG